MVIYIIQTMKSTVVCCTDYTFDTSVLCHRQVVQLVQLWDSWLRLGLFSGASAGGNAVCWRNRHWNVDCASEGNRGDRLTCRCVKFMKVHHVKLLGGCRRNGGRFPPLNKGWKSTAHNPSTQRPNLKEKREGNTPSSDATGVLLTCCLLLDGQV